MISCIIYIVNYKSDSEWKKATSFLSNESNNALEFPTKENLLNILLKYTKTSLIAGSTQKKNHKAYQKLSLLIL